MSTAALDLGGAVERVIDHRRTSDRGGAALGIIGVEIDAIVGHLALTVVGEAKPRLGQRRAEPGAPRHQDRGSGGKRRASLGVEGERVNTVVIDIAPTVIAETHDMITCAALANEVGIARLVDIAPGVVGEGLSPGGSARHVGQTAFRFSPHTKESRS